MSRLIMHARKSKMWQKKAKEKKGKEK